MTSPGSCITVEISFIRLTTSKVCAFMASAKNLLSPSPISHGNKPLPNDRSPSTHIITPDLSRRYGAVAVGDTPFEQSLPVWSESVHGSKTLATQKSLNLGLQQP
ncbi:hypothetical protein M758_10G056900 [Ceratodon purpureus]|uniref:Uncharacterized protein n=1 Tax=Ceratodon purpureus TaxID=3225 RepID=A0A8T0GKZ9_CERPU|nr:hypothetical protein KC19_10G060500 [Ceratodon purpureus]KAG0602985.1 hypothetical protein M758_10G056500 [Ceratodon purpureus]KAG0602989.1 hypothetical protein M758_10G056900 [Ceratodon purpureus]